MKCEPLKIYYLSPLSLVSILVFSSSVHTVVGGGGSPNDHIPDLKNATYFCHFSPAAETPIMTMRFFLYTNGETINTVYAHENYTFTPLTNCSVTLSGTRYEMTATVDMTTNSDTSQCGAATMITGQEWVWFVRTVARNGFDSYPDTVYEMNCNAAWAADGTPSLSPIQTHVNGTTAVTLAEEQLKMELVSHVTGNPLPEAVATLTPAKLQITFGPDANRRNYVDAIAVKLSGACYVSATPNPSDSTLGTQKFPLTEPDGYSPNGDNLGCPSIYSTLGVAPTTAFEEIDSGDSNYVMRTGPFDVTFFAGFGVSYYSCVVSFCRDENDYTECSNQCNYTTEHASRKKRQAYGSFSRYEDIRYLQVAVRNASFPLTTTTEQQPTTEQKKQEEPKEDLLVSVEILIVIVTLVVVVIIVVITAIVIAVMLRKDKARDKDEQEKRSRRKRKEPTGMHKRQPSVISSGPRYY